MEELIDSTTTKATTSAQTTISLRPYQQEALAAIAEAEKKGIHRQLIALPTGTGKTVIFSHVVSNRPGRALVLAHREELIGQAAEKILTVNPAASIGVVKADRNELNRQIVVASVQTLARDSRLSRIDTAGFTTVIVDEAHHAAADSYKRILDHFRCFGEDGPLTVGFTATPERADEKALGEIFSEIVYRQDILTMMQAGYLCDLRAIQVNLEADFNDLHSRHGDFIESEASEMLMAANAPAHAVASYLEHASGRKTLLFTPTVELSHRMVAAFTGQGISAEALSGETPMDEAQLGVPYALCRRGPRVCLSSAGARQSVDHFEDIFALGSGHTPDHDVNFGLKTGKRDRDQFPSIMKRSVSISNLPLSNEQVSRTQHAPKQFFGIAQCLAQFLPVKSSFMD
jgi:superfamily II DNA or RNA helicase